MSLSRTWWRFVLDRLRQGRAAQLAGEVSVILLALSWIIFLLVHPVHIPVLSPSQEVEPYNAQSLTGVQGQTFVAPTSRLSRIDLELDTRIPPGEWVHVTFELARGVQPRTTLASAIAIFDRSQQRLARPPVPRSRPDRGWRPPLFAS